MIIESVNPGIILDDPDIPNVISAEMAGFIKGEPGDQGPAGVQYNLETWASAQTFQLVSATRDANSAIVSATIVWPDGISGVFTTDIFSVDFPGAIDAWHATYAGNPAKLITQTVVTRDANGAVTAQPAITIV